MNIEPVTGIVSAALIGFCTAIPVLAMIIGILRKPKKNHASLCLTILTGAIAFVTALLVRKPLVDSLTHGLIAELLKGAGLADLVEKAPKALEYAGQIAVCIAAPFIFLVLFLFLRFIALLLNPLAAKMFRKDKPTAAAARWTGLGLGLVDGILLTVLIVFPLASSVSLAGNVMLSEDFGKITSALDLDTEAVTSAVESISSNAALRTVNTIGGKYLFNSLTQFGSGAEKTTVEEQVTNVERIAAAAAPLIETAKNGKISGESADAIKEVVSALNENAQLKGAAAEVVSAAGSSWSEGQSFMGVEKPAAEGITGALTNGLVTVMKETTADTLGSNLNTIAETVDTLDKTGVLGMLSGEEKADILDIISTPGAVSGVLQSLSQSDNLQPVVDGLRDAAVDTLSETLGLDAEGKEKLAGSLNINLKNLDEEETANLENIVVSAGKVVKSAKTSGTSEKNPGADPSEETEPGKTGLSVISNIDTKAMTAMFDAIEKSKSVDGDSLIGVVVDSDVVRETGMVDDKTAQIIKDGGTESLGNTVESAQKVAEMVDLLNKKNRTEEDISAISGNIGWLIENIDENTRDIILAQVTPANLNGFGVPEQCSAGVSELVGNVLNEMLAAEKSGNVSEGEAITNLYDIAIHTDFISGSAFSDGSDTADKLVNAVMDSDIIRSAVVDTAYDKNGNLRKDPLGTGMKYNRNDIEKLTSTMNAYLAKVGSAEKAEREKQILAVSALIGADARIENGVYTFAG